jgi:hypothetical protein
MENAFALTYLRLNTGTVTLFPTEVAPAAIELARLIKETPGILTDVDAFAPGDVGPLGAGALLILLSQFLAAANTAVANPKDWFAPLTAPNLPDGATNPERLADAVIRAAGYRDAAPRQQPPRGPDTVLGVPPYPAHAGGQGGGAPPGFTGISLGGLTDHAHLALAAGITARVFGSAAFHSEALPMALALDMITGWLNSMRRTSQIVSLLPESFSLLEKKTNMSTQGRDPGDTAAICAAMREYRIEADEGKTPATHPASFLDLLEEVPSLAEAVKRVHKRWDKEVAGDKKNKRMKRGPNHIEDFNDFIDHYNQGNPAKRQQHLPAPNPNGQPLRALPQEQGAKTSPAAMRQLRRLCKKFEPISPQDLNAALKTILGGNCAACRAPVSRATRMRCTKPACATAPAHASFVAKITAAATTADL